MFSIREIKVKREISTYQNRLNELRANKRMVLSRMYEKLEELIATKTRLGMDIHQDKDVKAVMDIITTQVDRYKERERELVSLISECKSSLGINTPQPVKVRI